MAQGRGEVHAVQPVEPGRRAVAALDGDGGSHASLKKAAEKIGQGSEAFAIHVKGLEWTGYECRNAPSMMLAYMTSDIGAHHARAWVLGHDLAIVVEQLCEHFIVVRDGWQRLPI